MRTVYFELDDKIRELKKKSQLDKDLSRQFLEKLEVSWIFHENALDGSILDVYDLKAALENITSDDGVLIPTYQRIRNYKNSIDKVMKTATYASRMPSLTFIKSLHVVLCYGIVDQQGGIYRKNIPIHRTYFHEIIPPNRISYQMNKLVRSFRTKEFKQNHPISQASQAHCRLMNIFPFDEETGKVARLIMNYFILRAGYLPVIIPDVERQRYYDSLKSSEQSVHDLIVECMEQMLEISIRFFDEKGHVSW